MFFKFSILKKEATDLWKNAGILAIGTALGQLILVLSTPLLTRLYSPADFGLFASYVSIITIVGVVCTGRYEFAIPIADSAEESAVLGKLSIIISLIFSAIAVSVLFIIDPVALKISEGGAGKLLFISITLIAANSTFNYLVLRQGSYKLIALSRIVQSSSVVAAQVGFFTFGILGLVGGHIIGLMFSVVVMLVSYCLTTTKKSFSPVVCSAKKANLLEVAKKYREYPFVTSWSSLANAAGSQLPNIIFAFMFGPAVAGYFFIASRVLGLPLAVAGRALGQAFLAGSKSALDKGNIYSFARGAVAKLLIISVLMVVLIFLVPESAVLVVFGEEYGQVRDYILVLSPLAAVQLLASPVAQLLVICKKVKTHLLMSLILLVLRVVPLLLFSDLVEGIEAVVLYSICGALGYFLFLATSLYYARKRECI